MGLCTPTILGGNSYLSWFYDRGTIKDQAHTGTSKGLSQVINRGPIRKFQPKYANIYVTSQSHVLSVGARTHYVTANGVRNGLCLSRPPEATIDMRRGNRKCIGGHVIGACTTVTCTTLTMYPIITVCQMMINCK